MNTLEDITTVDEDEVISESGRIFHSAHKGLLESLSEVGAGRCRPKQRRLRSRFTERAY